jgi:hypothetical protein
MEDAEREFLCRPPSHSRRSALRLFRHVELLTPSRVDADTGRRVTYTKVL